MDNCCIILFVQEGKEVEASCPVFLPNFNIIRGDNMYEGGKGSGLVSGVTSTTAGVALLPNTSGNILLTALGILTIILGLLAIASFIAGRVSRKLV